MVKPVWPAAQSPKISQNPIHSPSIVALRLAPPLTLEVAPPAVLYCPPLTLE